MKRHIASRKLKNRCDSCDKQILKGAVYYTKRNIWENEGEIIAQTEMVCARCHFLNKDRSIRFKRFKPKCHHPILNEVWSYIPGEAVMQPDHTECLICKNWIF